MVSVQPWKGQVLEEVRGSSQRGATTFSRMRLSMMTVIIIKIPHLAKMTFRKTIKKPTFSTAKEYKTLSVNDTWHNVTRHYAIQQIDTQYNNYIYHNHEWHSA